VPKKLNAVAARLISSKREPLMKPLLCWLNCLSTLRTPRTLVPESQLGDGREIPATIALVQSTGFVMLMMLVN
jgi:hypothetical protein